MNAERTPEAAPASPTARMSWVRQLEFWGFASLVVLAVAFYLWWGILYDAWLDNGVYAVTIVLLTFGLAGMWLILPNPPAPPPPPR
jgi:type VI protein secretion system component VasF